MANGDDGYSEVGGGGSIGWRVEAQNAALPGPANPKTKPKPPGQAGNWSGYTTKGLDNVKDEKDQLYQKYFHVQILKPLAGAKIKYGYNKKTKAFDIWVPIEKRRPANEGTDPRQIRVMWAAASVPSGGAEFDEAVEIDPPGPVVAGV
ncbi:MAG: hypothetical protein HY657_19580 [Acidobacteria bacterium]|nr:hypothetical protein [Acidobacteriota bacterium]